MEHIIFTGKIFDIVHKDVQLGNVQKTFEIARRSPGTRLIAIKKDNKILLTKEHRNEHDSYDYRLPGGKVFDKNEDYKTFLERGGDILEAATHGVKKEAAEEAGLIVHSVEFFQKSTCGATVDWDLYYFVTKDFEIKPEKALEEGEQIDEVVWLNPKEVLELIKNNEMKEDRSIAVLIRFFLVTNLILDGFKA